MSNNEETRNWTQLAAECKRLEEELEAARITIADYERAHAVTEALAKNNDVLRNVDDEQPPTKPLAKFNVEAHIASVRYVKASRPFDDDFDDEVDVEFAKFMFMEGALCERYPSDKKRRLDDAIEHWRKRQAK